MLLLPGGMEHWVMRNGVQRSPHKSAARPYLTGKSGRLDVYKTLMNEE